MARDVWVVVYTGGTADTALLCDRLQAAGVSARLGDEFMGTMAPFVLEGGTTAAVKVLVPEDQLEEARAVVAGFPEEETSTTPPQAFQPWECPACHEQNDGSFDICWNCQTER